MFQTTNQYTIVVLKPMVFFGCFGDPPFFQNPPCHIHKPPAISAFSANVCSTYQNIPINLVTSPWFIWFLLFNANFQSCLPYMAQRLDVNNLWETPIRNMIYKWWVNSSSISVCRRVSILGTGSMGWLPSTMAISPKQ